MKNSQKGITLVALVVTIIILLLLAGITISSLIGSGLFEKTQEAERQSEIARIKEEIQLDIYEKQLANLGSLSDQDLETILGKYGTISYEEDGTTVKGITTEDGYEILLSEIYTGGTTTNIPQEPEQPPVTLASKVNIGDYVQYIPDTVTTEVHNALITELGTYSGNTDTSYNTASKVTQETSLNWRVLDKVKDENGKDCVRLISATPTTSTVRLYSYNGYNNAVYLLDKTCNTFYNKAGYTKNIQNLKIEDIEMYMKTKPTLSHITISPTNKNYPSILLQEANQTVTIGENTTTGTLELSEQIVPINQTTVQSASSWSLKTTYYDQTMTTDSFTNAKYYNLFINDGENFYPTYWMSSRCVGVGSTYANFSVRFVYYAHVAAPDLCHSDDNHTAHAFALRPVITLKSDVLVDTTDNTKDGTEAGKAYILKNNV